MVSCQFDVCYSAKIGILKQITTTLLKYKESMGCLLLCKDRNFKANHNAIRRQPVLTCDVCYSAKIGILKQITTLSKQELEKITMFVTLQR